MHSTHVVHPTRTWLSCQWSPFDKLSPLADFSHVMPCLGLIHKTSGMMWYVQAAVFIAYTIHVCREKKTLKSRKIKHLTSGWQFWRIGIRADLCKLTLQFNTVFNTSFSCLLIYWLPFMVPFMVEETWKICCTWHRWFPAPAPSHRWWEKSRRSPCGCERDRRPPAQSWTALQNCTEECQCVGMLCNALSEIVMIYNDILIYL